MSRALGAADGLVVSGHFIRAAAIEGVVFRHHPLLQGGGQHHRLEGGTRLIPGVQCLAAPLGVYRVGIGLGLGLLQQFSLGETLRVVLFQVGIDVVGILLHLLVEQLVGDGGVVVGVEAGGAGHGQNRPRLGVHHDAKGPVAHIIGLDPLGQGLFRIGLDGGIDGQGQVIAVDGIDKFGIVVIHLGARTGTGGDDPACRALEHIVIGRLDAHRAPLGIDKSQGLGRQTGIGVIPLGPRHQIEVVGGLVLDDIVPDGLGILLLDLSLDLPVGVLRGPDLFFQLLLVQVRDQAHQVLHQLVLGRLHRGVPGPLVQVAVVVCIVLLVHAVLHQVLGG